MWFRLKWIKLNKPNELVILVFVYCPYKMASLLLVYSRSFLKRKTKDKPILLWRFWNFKWHNNFLLEIMYAHYLDELQLIPTKDDSFPAMRTYELKNQNSIGSYLIVEKQKFWLKIRTMFPLVWMKYHFGQCEQETYQRVRASMVCLLNDKNIKNSSSFIKTCIKEEKNSTYDHDSKPNTVWYPHVKHNPIQVLRINFDLNPCC